MGNHRNSRCSVSVYELKVSLCILYLGMEALTSYCPPGVEVQVVVL
jgi:hypothetical protein